MSNHLKTAKVWMSNVDALGLTGPTKAQLSLTHATIALAEQAEIANRIALAQALIAAGQPQEAATWLQELHAELTE